MTAREKLHICVLESSTEGSGSPLTDCEPHRQPEVFDTDGEFEWSRAYIRKATSAKQVLDLVSSGKYDVFMNLCDGAWDEDRAGQDVIEALERFNVPYTGADTKAYDICKILMKMAVQAYGVEVPPFVHIQAHGGRGQDAFEAGIAKVLAPPSRGGLRFPLIVKHPRGYSSVGMTRASKVYDEQQLREQVRRLLTEFGGALVEEFIPGREFTVLVVEEPRPPGHEAGPDESPFQPVAYDPVECAFPSGEDFKHFDLKWRDYGDLHWKPCDDPKLAERLKEAACSALEATRVLDYGRSDFRVTPSGDIYFLEINPNCGVFYPRDDFGSADFILTLDPTGTRDHLHFIRTIVHNALERHRLKQKTIAPAFIRKPPLPAAAAAAAANGQPAFEEAGRTPSSEPAAAQAEYADGGGAGGWGLVALAPIRAGEIVQRKEHQKQVIASLSYVEKNWPPGSRNRVWFDEYAWHLADEVVCTWSDDPAEWEPVNHSCDPSCVVDGLNVIARRDIKPGEQITLDYATYNVEHMAAFDCHCGAACCRGRIKGTDHLEPWLVEKYGDNLGIFVKVKRRRAAEAAAAAAEAERRTAATGNDA